MAPITMLGFAILFTGCPMNDQHSTVSELPRFSKLDAFDPHRRAFECKYEADANPPFTAKAEALFLQGMAATSHDLWPDARDYKKAAQLWGQASEQGYWKAQFNLAGLYLKGSGVPQDIERAIALTEDLMRRGVPAAWDNMGTYYMGGVGPLNQDASVAYAFWQKAADMGSMAAQAYLGEKLNAGYDDPPSFWGNKTVGLKMLECAFAQGSGNAAYQIARSQNGDAKQREDYAHALETFQAGARLGSEKAANSLAVAFNFGRPLVDHRVDLARAERYSVLGDALWRNPDLRFPNIDKVLPLPPAQLPQWDGDKQTLIDAAKALVAQPAAQPSQGSQRTGRARIPLSHELLPQTRRIVVETNSPVPYAGYWQPRLYAIYREHEQLWERAQVPQRYIKGESFEPVDRSSMGPYARVAPRTVWHYLGEAVPVIAALHPRVAQGVARMTRMPGLQLRCRGDMPCPRTGVWCGQVGKEHPLAALYNCWDRMAYADKGQLFPSPIDQHMDIEPDDVHWTWLDNANQAEVNGIVNVTLTDLHDERGGGQV